MKCLCVCVCEYVHACTHAFLSVEKLCREYGHTSILEGQVNVHLNIEHLTIELSVCYIRFMGYVQDFGC